MFPENRLMEVLIIGALALIVVGPKDLPVLMRRVGQFVGKMRGMAAEFRASFDELARQSELDELRKEVEALRRQNPLDAVNPMTDDHVAATFNDINAGLGAQMTPLSGPSMAGGAVPAYEAAAEAAHAAVGSGPVDLAPEAAFPASAASTSALDAEPSAKPKRAPRKPRAAIPDAS